LFTHKSNNILSIIGITFTVFLETGEHLQVFECSVAAISQALEDHLFTIKGGYILLAAN
jgi:hypothetical protein